MRKLLSKKLLHSLDDIETFSFAYSFLSLLLLHLILLSWHWLICIPASAFLGLLLLIAMLARLLDGTALLNLLMISIPRSSTPSNKQEQTTSNTQQRNTLWSWSHSFQRLGWRILPSQPWGPSCCTTCHSYSLNLTLILMMRTKICFKMLLKRSMWIWLLPSTIQWSKSCVR